MVLHTLCIGIAVIKFRFIKGKCNHILSVVNQTS